MVFPEPLKLLVEQQEAHGPHRSPEEDSYMFQYHFTN